MWVVICEGSFLFGIFFLRSLLPAVFQLRFCHSLVDLGLVFRLKFESCIIGIPILISLTLLLCFRKVLAKHLADLRA